MIFSPDRKILEVVGAIEPAPLEASVFRWCFSHVDPLRPNRSGARWNPPDVEALYASLERDVCLAEMNHLLDLHSIPITKSRVLCTIEVSLQSVLELTEDTLAELGLSADVLSSVDLSRCQQVGGAVQWLNHDGLLVPSARHEQGRNLVIFQTNHDEESIVELTDKAPLE